MRVVSDIQIIRRRVKQLEKKVRALERDNRSLYEEMAERGKVIEKVWTLLQGGSDLIEENLYESMKKPILEYVIRNSEKNSPYYREAISKMRTRVRKLENKGL